MIAFLGDSNTRGTFETVSLTQRWTCLVSLNRGAQEVNRGFGGENTRNGLSRIGEIISILPEWCVISYGTNDAYYTEPPYVPVAEYESNLRSMYLQLYSADIKTVFLTPPVSHDATLEARIGDYVQAMRRVAYKYKIPLVDWHAYTAELSTRDYSAYLAMCLDSVHLNAQGQAALASFFNLPQHAELLKSTVPYVPPTPSNPPTDEPVKVYARVNQLNGAYNLDSINLTNASTCNKTALGRVRVTYATPLASAICPILSVGEPGNYCIFPMSWTNSYVDVGVRFSHLGTDCDASFVVVVP